MIIKVSFLAAATIAAYAVSHKNSCNSTKNPPGSSLILCQFTEKKEQFFAFLYVKSCMGSVGNLMVFNFFTIENDDSRFQQHQIEGEMEDEKEAEIIRSKELKSVNEIKVLNNLVKEGQQRKMRLEGKLLELCGLREEHSYMAHLQRHLDNKSSEIEMLNATIASMQAERKNLHEDVKQCVLARKQLETARKVIAEMQKKMDYCNESNMKIKGRLLIVEEQVSNFPRDKDEGNSVRDAILEKKLKDVRNVELQALKMKRRNKELELGKRELVVKLVSAQEKITALSNITEVHIKFINSYSITNNTIDLKCAWVLYYYICLSK